MPCEALFCSRFLTRNSKGAPFGFYPRVMSVWRWSCQRPVTFALLRTFVRISKVVSSAFTFPRKRQMWNRQHWYPAECKDLNRVEERHNAQLQTRKNT
jgi:hypothetical protein